MSQIIPDIPMTVDELERMRQLLYKADVQRQTLTQMEQDELRSLVAKGEPEKAKDADLSALILLGLFLIGLYVTILILDKDKAKPASA